MFFFKRKNHKLQRSFFFKIIIKGKLILIITTRASKVYFNLKIREVAEHSLLTGSYSFTLIILYHGLSINFVFN